MVQLYQNQFVMLFGLLTSTHKFTQFSCIFQCIWTNELYKYHHWWFMLVKFLLNTSSCLPNPSCKKTKMNRWRLNSNKKSFRWSFFVHWVYSFLEMHRKQSCFKCLLLFVVGQVINNQEALEKKKSGKEAHHE